MTSPGGAGAGRHIEAQGSGTGGRVASLACARVAHAPNSCSKPRDARLSRVIAADVASPSTHVTPESPPVTGPVSTPSSDAGRYENARPVVERLLDRLVRRTYLPEAETEEFRALAHAHLVEREGHVLRQHEGRASLETYLAVVLSHLLSDFRNALWGKWRPSAHAKRVGWVAIRMEELLYRDGYPPREAVMRLTTQAPELRERDLWELVRVLPRRAGVRVVPIEQADGPAIARIEPGDDAVVRDEEERAVLVQCVREAVEELDSEDRLIALMHYVDDASLATVSRVLRVPQRPLYRRRDAILKRLRQTLEARGVLRDRVRELLEAERDR